MGLWKRLFKRSGSKKSQSAMMLERLMEINKTKDYDALKEFAKEIGAYILEKKINFVHIDKIDGTGGFMIPDEEGNKEIIKGLLKNPEYVLRNEGRS